MTGEGPAGHPEGSRGQFRRSVLGLALVLLGLGGCGESSLAPTEPAPALGRVVFVSSTIFTGAIGGVPAADQACARLAVAAGLRGVYRAWLSDDAGVSPSVTFTQTGAPFVMTSGVRVADHWADLTDGTINNPIVVDERGRQPDTVPVVWTGTDPTGHPAPGGVSCGGWSSASLGVPGQVGTFDAIGRGWSAWRAGDCHQYGRLYCFEQ